MRHGAARKTLIQVNVPSNLHRKSWTVSLRQITGIGPVRNRFSRIIDPAQGRASAAVAR
jgi:hypothetical protein